jgi:ribosomal-protein-alanine N-acetyltransferase
MENEIKEGFFYQTKKLIIRPYQDRDFQDFLILLANPLVNSSLGITEFSNNPQMVRKFLTQMSSKKYNNTWLLYSILFNKLDKHLIGGCGFKVDTNQISAELFFMLFPRYWGQGLMVEAIHLLLDNITCDFGWKQIYALILPENTRAQRVVAKLGFQYDQLTDLNRYDLKTQVQRWILKVR